LTRANQPSMPISRRAKMIMSTISPVGRSLGGPEACRGLTTEGSGADRPDVAGDVVTVAPIHFEAASPRKGREPETKSNHADIRNERTIRNLLTHQSAFVWLPAPTCDRASLGRDGHRQDHRRVRRGADRPARSPNKRSTKRRRLSLPACYRASKRSRIVCRSGDTDADHHHPRHSQKNARCRNGANGEAETSPECW
jgi:hypothetical protein